MALRRLFDDLRSLRLQGLPDALADDYRRFRETLVSFLPGKPGAIATILRSPAVAAPLRCLRDGVGDRERSVAELVTQGLYQLELRGALSGPIALRAPSAWKLSPLDGVAEGPEDAQCYWQVQGHGATAMYLALRDNNPLQLLEAHPDKDGNAVDLGGRSPEEWIDALRRALELIELIPGLRREADLLIKQFVPVGFDRSRHMSATYREAIGTIYLSLHPDPMTMAEALVHELSHTKLNALLELDPVLLNDPNETHASPVRPDPRPLLGILLAVHAFVPVAHLYARLVETDHPLANTPQFARRRAAIVAGNADGNGVLQTHARPSEAGKGVLDEIDDWVRRQSAALNASS